ncbi:putative oxidoreductase protein [Lentisphaera araneosa HTCC2155]|uniref:Putative oxidoreductase protein n=1 Tax=Lentisphaera araneosa HTCC2155 TaxID=313628 RepID=A6DHW7_9BACT|nr:FAD-binding protein [Lentisphaera araneosa]EDM28621.1 putative oxidoreductase protein [Lentisphaera araneosa HTCC2155]
MSQSIPQHILDSLTRVKMPGGASERQSHQIIEIAGMQVPVYTTSSLVLGSGAAGLRAAVELKRKNVDVTVASSAMFGGTSACSGSDKQTLHTAGTSNRGDDFVKLGQDISSGGGMDKDTAYIEGVDSLRAFNSLQYMGLPLPQDRFGAVLRYQTDHDEVGRATSCGPRTSRLMVKVLCEEAIRLGVDFLKGTTGVQILKSQKNGEEVCSGLIAINRTDETNEFGLIVILCDKLILATGGPGELYRDSVYPKNCFGSLGMALEAGVEATNLTESQFGIGTRRTEFPWNLSGTYVQVLPYIYSLDKDGNEHNFLAEYYRTTQELVSNVFRKGYQWPFHATRMLDYGSSLVDLAIYIESQKGRTILMDFNRNPEAVPNEQDFSLERLDDDVRDYLVNNEALQELPIDRLRQMNPLAIELYKMHGHDIGKDPLPFNVSNQHMNGGVDVDIWSQSSLNSCYAIGEVAGTHGVTRPGGAALNAGQVFGTRCAEHIASQGAETPEISNLDQHQETITSVFAELKKAVEDDSQPSCEEVRDIIQNRMSDKAGFICQRDDVLKALLDTQTLNRKLEKGLSIKTSRHAASYFQWRQTALSAEAVLNCLTLYIKNGGGSRGARALCAKDGQDVPETRLGELNEYRFITEKEEHKEEKIVIGLDPKTNDFVTRIDALREMEDPGKIFFEKNWAPYLTEAIYQDGFKH